MKLLPPSKSLDNGITGKRLSVEAQQGLTGSVCRGSWGRSNTDTAGAAPELLQKRKHPHFLSEAKQSSNKTAGLEQVNASPGKDRAQGSSRNME